MQCLFTICRLVAASKLGQWIENTGAIALAVQEEFMFENSFCLNYIRGQTFCKTLFISLVYTLLLTQTMVCYCKENDRL